MHGLPVANGVSALAVVSIARPSPFLTSHAQPEPNWPAAASLNLVLKSAKLPNDLSIAVAIAPVGLPPPLGASELQKKVWFQTCAELLKIFFSLAWPCDALTTSSSDIDSYLVPGANLLRLSTYALWCLP